jgi:hypothetical protein
MMADIDATSARVVAQANPKDGFLAGLVREHLPSLGELEPSRLVVRIPSPGRLHAAVGRILAIHNDEAFFHGAAAALLTSSS